jgi:CRISPR-associated protein Csd1
MILKALYDLALREGLDPFYEPKEVHYVIELGPGGKFLGIREPLDEPPLDAHGKAKGKARPPKRPIPRRSERRSQDQAEFLVDKADYVLGRPPTEAKGAKWPELAERTEQRRALFLERILSGMSDPQLQANSGLLAVTAFLRTDHARRVSALADWLKRKEKDNPKDLDSALFAFMYTPDGGTACVHDHADVKAYFTEHISTPATAARGQCLVTGERDVLLATLHAAPKGIPPPKLTKGGVPLTSVNKPAFCSYDLDSIGCAPVSIKANHRIDAALTRLLDVSHPDPTTGNPMPPRRVDLGPTTALVYWSREDAAVDFVVSLDEADPEQVKAMLRSPHKGRPAALDDTAAFYALILSGTQGRGIVRSFVESTVRDVARNVERYFSEARLTRPFGAGDGTYPLVVLRRSLVFEGNLERLPPDLATQLYLSILYGRNYPRVTLEAAVRRNRADLLPDRGAVWGPEALAARCSLIKAYLIRNLRKEVSVSLDLSRPEPAYRLGRLLAVLDRIQTDALGSVNATIVDRYYGSASSTPAAVMPTLVRRCQHHLGKLRRDKPGWAVVQEKLLQEVMGGLWAFPATLSLEEQGMFALGFYHQRQNFYVKKEREER